MSIVNKAPTLLKPALVNKAAITRGEGRLGMVGEATVVVPPTKYHFSLCLPRPFLCCPIYLIVASILSLSFYIALHFLIGLTHPHVPRLSPFLSFTKYQSRRFRSLAGFVSPRFQPQSGLY